MRRWLEEYVQESRAPFFCCTNNHKKNNLFDCKVCSSLPPIRTNPTDFIVIISVSVSGLLLDRV